MRTLPTINKQALGQEREELAIQELDGAMRSGGITWGAFAASMARQILPGWVHGLPGLNGYPTRPKKRSGLQRHDQSYALLCSFCPKLIVE
jgi:hypothetical protein